MIIAALLKINDPVQYDDDECVILITSSEAHYGIDQ